MSALPGVNQALESEQPVEAFDSSHVNGAPWQPDWRDAYLISPDSIQNHNIPAALGIFDGADNASEWNQYQGNIQSDPIPMGTQEEIRLLGAPAYMQVMRIPQPDAIDQFDRHPDHGQMQITGVDSIAAMVPYLELPDYGQGQDPNSMAGFGGRGGLPFHFDYGQQYTQGSAIGPRQIFRSPPAYSDQTAGIVAAGF
jgi:hypothetical protein